MIGAGKPTLRIRGTSYPVLLPSLRDPRLHLAAVIVSLQVLGQVAFDFRLSIAQILVSLLTCAVLEMGIAFRRQHVILWPASALLTGNGVAFILRVPGTEHGDWWSMHGWWVFAGTAAVSLLSKHLIQFRGGHIFNPSNFGLVLCFLLLGPELADPLEFWWGPMSAWLALALAIIVGGGFAILRRLRLLHIAVTFWVTFVASIAVLAASGHDMTTRWHLGPVSDWHFWRVLAFSPEILVFLFFMITDPKTIPAGKVGRRVYAVAIGLLAALLIAPQTTEFGAKVALLAALALVCAARPILVLAAPVLRRRVWSTRTVGAAALAGAVAFASLLVVAGIPARSNAEARVLPAPAGTAPEVSVRSAKGIAPIDRQTAERISLDLAADLANESEALRRRDRARAAAGADGARLAALWRQIDASAGRPPEVPRYTVERVRLSLEPGDGQAPPVVVASATGTVRRGGATTPFAETFELVLKDGRYLITGARGAAAPVARSGDLGGVRLRDVAAQVGLDFRHAAFRFGITHEEAAMMGGGLCWLDYDDDGRLDLYVVNAYGDEDYVAVDGARRPAAQRALPQRRWALRGRQPRLGRRPAAPRQRLRRRRLRPRRQHRPLRDDGRLQRRHERVRRAALGQRRRHLHRGRPRGRDQRAGLALRRGRRRRERRRPPRPLRRRATPTPTCRCRARPAGSPPTSPACATASTSTRDPDASGRSRFREVGRLAGLEPTQVDHGLGAVFTDVDDDGRLDLYVANDLDPNRLYLNKARPDGLGFRLRRARAPATRRRPECGNGDRSRRLQPSTAREDLFVTNSRRQLHAAYRSAPAAFADARPDFAPALGTDYTGWGVSWVDLDLDTHLDLVLANGAIPVESLAKDAERLQVLENLTGEGRRGEFADAGAAVGINAVRPSNGRGLAAADYDNDGDLDVAVNSIGGRLMLLRNDGAAGHWLEVKLDRFAPGTTVTAVLPGGRRLVREVHAGSSYLSSEDPRVHFGLGAATTVRELVVRWPDGRETRLTDVAADRLLTVTP